MEDVAVALTGSLPRDGSAPMTGPLTLQAAPPTQPRHAVSKGYMENFLAYATGMAIGMVVPIAGATVPPGFLLCDGQAVSRTTYPELFASIGTIYGSGDGTTTFNVPDLRDWFVRGKGDLRAVGSVQAAGFASHTHPFQDPGHAHVASQPAHDHTITTGGHTHGVNDPGHSHTFPFFRHDDNGPLVGNANNSQAGTVTVSTSGTGISVAAVGNLGGTTDLRQPAVTVTSNTTGATVGVTGDTETRPQNVAMNYVIKAVNDSAQTVNITGITSSDDNAISIDRTLPTVPMLDIHTNVAFGLVKLDASAKVPLGLLPSSSQQLLGYWDASGGQTPSENNPSINYASGDTYVISVGGTLTVYNPVTLTASPTSVAVSSLLQYVENSLTNPTGWYYVVSSTTVVASQVGFSPVGDVSANNVQGAIAELDSETQAGLATKVSKSGDTMTGSLAIDTNDSPSITMRVSGVTKGYFYASAYAIGLLNNLGNSVFYNPVGTTDLVVAGNLTAANLSGTNTGNQTATQVPFTPAGNIAATNVQNAINELDTEKLAIAALNAQQWQTVTGSRVLGGVYTNGTALPIQVLVSFTSPAGISAVQATVGVTPLNSAYAVNNQFTGWIGFTVPAGQTYAIDGLAGGPVVDRWNELRS